MKIRDQKAINKWLDGFLGDDIPGIVPTTMSVRQIRAAALSQLSGT